MPFVRTEEPAEPTAAADAPSFTSLLKRLGSETGELVRAEVALAKLEFKDLAAQTARDGLKVAAALALALVGALAVTAWGVLALGELLGGRHATAALIIGLVFLITGGLLARSAVRSLGRAGESSEAITSLRQNRDWAAGELHDLKAELSGGEAPPTALHKPAP